MHHVITEDLKRQAAEHLAMHDPLLKPVIATAGLATISPHRDYYHALVSSIIGQQLSVKAAATIKDRFKGLFGDRFPEPQEILDTSIEDLRSVGLSKGKATYVQDLAQHILDGRIDFDGIDDLSNEAIIKKTHRRQRHWRMDRTHVPDVLHGPNRRLGGWRFRNPNRHHEALRSQAVTDSYGSH